MKVLKRTREIVKRIDVSERAPIVRTAVERGVCCPSGPKSRLIMNALLEVD